MFVFSNLATSLDGKIATTSRKFFPLGTPLDLQQMQVLRKECDAVLMGATTLRTFRKPLLIRDRQEDQPINVILSSELKGISPTWPFFKEKRIQRVLFVSHRADRKKLKAFEKTSNLIVLKKPTSANPTARQIISRLGELGVKRLLVEGGGGVMWDFSSHDLIDEYHVTITPRILGGTEAPTLVDGEGFEPARVVNLRLSQCRVVGNELYLIYRKTGKRGPALPT